MLICLVGPSGAGKTSIENELVNKHGYIALKSHTTRPKRHPGEDTYNFVTNEEFHKLDFVECTNPYSDAWYGLSKQEVDQTNDNSKKFVVTVEMHGVIDLLKYCSCHVHPMFITAPFEQLARRLKSREVPMEDRIASILRDCKVAKLCDCMISNGDNELEQAINEILMYDALFREADKIHDEVSSEVRKESQSWRDTKFVGYP